MDKFKSLFNCCFPTENRKEKLLDEFIKFEDDDKTNVSDNKSMNIFSQKTPNKNQLSQSVFHLSDLRSSGSKSNMLYNNLITKRNNDESSFDMIANTNRNITEEEIKRAPNLIIEEIEGNLLYGNSMEIRAFGLNNGKRNVKDGIVFFGSRLTNIDGIIINDFLLNLSCPENLSHIFIIYYKKGFNKYYLRAF